MKALTSFEIAIILIALIIIAAIASYIVLGLLPLAPKEQQEPTDLCDGACESYQFCYVGECIGEPPIACTVETDCPKNFSCFNQTCLFNPWLP